MADDPLTEIGNPPPPPPLPGHPPPPPPQPAVLPQTLEECHAEIIRLTQLQAEADDLIARLMAERTARAAR
jgi:hypothetical protein